MNNSAPMRNCPGGNVGLISSQSQHLLGCTITDDGLRLEIADYGRRVVVRIKISCVFTMQLICDFQKPSFLMKPTQMT